MGQLLQQASARGISTEYTNHLLAALDAKTKDAGPRTDSEPLPDLDPLSARELEVLRLLPTYRSRKEIAEHLCVSLNTARFHLKNIYNKLGVHSRADAIHRAKELNLL